MSELTAQTGTLGRPPAVVLRYPRRLAVPAYDRDQLSPAVVHIGVGGFHRAHQAVYFDELAAAGCTQWGVIGVGISRPELGDVLDIQDNLFAVIERHPAHSRVRIIGSMVEYLLLAEDPQGVRRRMSDPATRLVTMTITANGYAVAGDALGSGYSVFAALVDALDSRRRAGLPPFTVLSCDNMPDSGGAAKRATLAVARGRSGDLAEWIDEHVRFPESMVDRITPVTSVDERKRVIAEFGLDDRWPVVTEPWTQWVIEDCFTDGRPPLDSVGVRFVDDVGPYKLIKTRLLNGTHSALGYLGYLAGCRGTAEAMADPHLARYVERLMRAEIMPLLPDHVDGMELDSYTHILSERFANPAIGDQLARLCARGSNKMVDYLLPSLHEAGAAGRPRQLLTLAVAAWCVYLRGVDLHGEFIEITDPRLHELQPLAALAVDDPLPLLGVEDIFGALAGDAHFCAELRQMLRLLDRRGVHAAIAECLGTT